ncbi:MAG: response regulator transcription factor [Abitibacteriaceae bacterium]|nr:response regulator transcription factor [Abditibacteriaceae bacterium]
MALPTVPSDGKFRILVVEDDSNIARLVLANLNRAGLECRYAQDGVVGLKAFQEADPHLILTDIQMPNLDGKQLCAKVRETSTIPIIMMTAADSEETQMQGFKLGADDYIPKPFNPKLLVARVVANLRRVYRYDFTAEVEEKKEKVTNPDSIPSGWAACNICGYMGPRAKFQNLNNLGSIYSQCPRCQEAENISYAID